MLHVSKWEMKVGSSRDLGNAALNMCKCAKKLPVLIVQNFIG